MRSLRLCERLSPDWTSRPRIMQQDRETLSLSCFCASGVDCPIRTRLCHGVGMFAAMPSSGMPTVRNVRPNTSTMPVQSWASALGMPRT